MKIHATDPTVGLYAQAVELRLRFVMHPEGCAIGIPDPPHPDGSAEDLAAALLMVLIRPRYRALMGFAELVILASQWS